MNNYYFPTYKKIESEVCELAYSIHITDDNLNVYSLKISDLICRCAIELESIAKSLYRQVIVQGSEKEPTPGEIFKWIERNYNISKKAISIVSDSVYLVDSDMTPYFCPFEYKKEDEKDYYTVYCSLKHDKVKNIKKANIYTLLRILGALYILNIIYYNKSYNLHDDMNGLKMDKTAGSLFFSFYVLNENGKVVGDYDNKLKAENCIYKIKHKQYRGFQNINDIRTRSVQIFPAKVVQDELKHETSEIVSKERALEIVSKDPSSVGRLEEIGKDFDDYMKITALPREYSAVINLNMHGK